MSLIVLYNYITQGWIIYKLLFLMFFKISVLSDWVLIKTEQDVNWFIYERYYRVWLKTSDLQMQLRATLISSYILFNPTLSIRLSLVVIQNI